MAIAIENILPEGTTRESYMAVGEALDAGGNPPAGMISHHGGIKDGRIRVVEVWESRADYDAFVEDRLRPAIRQVVGEEVYAQMPDAEPVEYEVLDHS